MFSEWMTQHKFDEDEQDDSYKMDNLDTLSSSGAINSHQIVSACLASAGAHRTSLLTFLVAAQAMTVKQHDHVEEDETEVDYVVVIGTITLISVLMCMMVCFCFKCISRKNDFEERLHK